MGNKKGVKKGALKKEASKKDNPALKLSFIAITILMLLLVVLVFAAAKMQLGRISPDLNTPVEKSLPNGVDFMNLDEGALEGWTREQYYKEPIDEVVVLFASARIPGLAIIYYPKEERIVAGTPQMVVNGIRLFDGQTHQTAYAFARNGRQRFFYDGKMVAESDFDFYESGLTGMAVGAPELIVSESFVVEKIS